MDQESVTVGSSTGWSSRCSSLGRRPTRAVTGRRRAAGYELVCKVSSTDERDAYDMCAALEAAGAVLTEKVSYEVVETILRH